MRHGDAFCPIRVWNAHQRTQLEGRTPNLSGYSYDDSRPVRRIVLVEG